MLKYYEYKYGTSIPCETQIGSGFYMSDVRSIVIDPYTVIGKNCNLSPQITLGTAATEAEKGYPVIGDNVYIGPGAKVTGPVHVGNHVAISANSVVIRDVPDHSVVCGTPGKVAPLDDSAVYIYRTNYER